MLYAEIIIDISAEELDKAFTYAVPEELKDKLYPGVRVNVPFGNGGRKRKGVVIALSTRSGLRDDQIKYIDSLL